MLGDSELAVVFILAFLLIGPNKLSEFARTLGNILNKLKKSVNENELNG